MSPTQTTQKAWLAHPIADIVVGCGAWSLPFILVVGALSGHWVERIATLFYALVLVVNFPHYAATVHRAYRSKEGMHNHKLSMVWGTLLILGALVYVHLNPTSLAWLFTLYLLWSPWHYSAQNQGIATLFLRRAEAEHDDKDRKRFRTGFILSFLVWVLGMQTGNSTPLLLRLNLDEQWVNPLRVVLLVGFFIAVVPPLLKAKRTAKHKNAVFAAAVVVFTQSIWFALPWLMQVMQQREISLIYFVSGSLAFMHCAQYLWFVYATEKREHQQAGYLFRPAMWFLGLVTTGSALFFLGPLSVSHGLKMDLAVSLLAFQAAINIHHFLIDGVIWKLREPRFKTIVDVKAAKDESVAPVERERAAPLALVLAASAALVLVGILGVTQYVLTTRSAPMEWVERAASLNPFDKRVDLRFAEDLVRKDQLDIAIETLVMASQQSPGNADVQLSTVRFLALQERTEEAYELLEKQPIHFRDHFVDDVHLAAMAIKIGRLDDAKKWLDAAEKRDPSHAELFRYRALLAIERDDIVDLVNATQAMVAAFEKIGAPHPLKMKPPDEDYVHLILASSKALRELKRPEEAKENLSLLVDASIHLNRPDLTLFAQAEKARNAQARGQIREARREFARALERTRHTNLPVDEGELWLSFGVLLEETRIPLIERFALVLKAKQAASAAVVDDVDKDLRAVVLKKAAFESLTKMGFALSPSKRLEVRENLDFIVEGILKRERN
ncbi:MAG: hypothetical protein GY822_08190 [Deltaproteobacteria bacterium]|nr:hypothetical protein [Deltaproteobacteria bacterium]